MTIAYVGLGGYNARNNTGERQNSIYEPNTKSIIHLRLNCITWFSPLLLRNIIVHNISAHCKYHCKQHYHKFTYST